MQPVSRMVRFNIPAVLAALLVLSWSSAAEYREPPIGQVISNAQSTDATVLIKIVEVEELRTEGDYTTSAIKAIVQQQFEGNVAKGADIQYERTVESSFEAAAVDEQYIASFNKENGNLVLPGEGYHFPYSSELEEALTAKFADKD